MQKKRSIAVHLYAEMPRRDLLKSKHFRLCTSVLHDGYTIGRRKKVPWRVLDYDQARARALETRRSDLGDPRSPKRLSLFLVDIPQKGATHRTVGLALFLGSIVSKSG